jgi:hypothetical protein
MLAGGVAYAERPPVPPPSAPDQLFGLRVSLGRLPVADRALSTSGIGLAFEHRLRGRWRVLAEYEYLWVGERDDERPRQDVIDGSGHRAQLGLRVMLADRWTLGSTLRLYVDLEAGGGIIYASEPMTGALVGPIAFVGVRAGYDFVFDSARSGSSRVLEPELLVRATRSEDGTGVLFGVGFGWGD